MKVPKHVEKDLEVVQESLIKRFRDNVSVSWGEPIDDSLRGKIVVVEVYLKIPYAKEISSDVWDIMAECGIEPPYNDGEYGVIQNEGGFTMRNYKSLRE